jgi:23S rRNA (cytosine1962-C5)-methyltransferase
VSEGELKFSVRLGDGLQTGLFVDQRNNRARVRELAPGGRMLNLFSYTCSFSVAAALGGAATVSVDLSARALARGRENFALNGLDATRHAFDKDDALEWLARARRRGRRFDLVVLDPPSFGMRGRHKTFSVAHDYGRAARDAFRLLAPGGRLLAVTNHRKTSLGELRRIVRDAAASAGRELAQLKDLPSGVDCPDAPDGPAPSKSVLATVR